MSNLPEISEESLKKDMKKTFGLLFSQDPSADFTRFVLVSALDENGKITNIIPNPEILRVYAISEKGRVEEWADMCQVDNFDMFLGVVLSYAKKWDKMKVVFTTDDHETVEDFTVEKLSPTHNK